MKCCVPDVVHRKRIPQSNPTGRIRPRRVVSKRKRAKCRPTSCKPWLHLVPNDIFDTNHTCPLLCVSHTPNNNAHDNRHTRRDCIRLSFATRHHNSHMSLWHATRPFRVTPRPCRRENGRILGRSAADACCCEFYKIRVDTRHMSSRWR